MYNYYLYPSVCLQGGLQDLSAVIRRLLSGNRASPLHRRIAGGCVQWVHLHPQGGEKNRRNLQGKFASAPPHFFATFFAGWGDLEGRSGSFSIILACVLRGDD